jgi:hypothetical protein
LNVVNLLLIVCVSVAAPSALLTKEQPTDDVDASRVQDLLGKTVYVEWPYLKEALVLGISDGECRTSQAQGTVKHSPVPTTTIDPLFSSPSSPPDPRGV